MAVETPIIIGLGIFLMAFVAALIVLAVYVLLVFRARPSQTIRNDALGSGFGGVVRRRDKALPKVASVVAISSVFFVFAVDLAGIPRKRRTDMV